MIDIPLTTTTQQKPTQTDTKERRITDTLTSRQQSEMEGKGERGWLDCFQL